MDLPGPIVRLPDTDRMARALLARHRHRTADWTVAQLAELLEDAVYHERLRMEEEPPDEQERLLVRQAARAVVDGREHRLREAAALLVDAYAREIHHPFSRRAFQVATRVLPAALTRLVTATDPARLISGDFDPASRIRVGGEVEAVVRLASRGTLMLLPTHLSNLDSPLLGYGAWLAGLPPFAYGAGLNLFSNPIMAFWMSRLGAYTVDRRKRHRLYKDTLKDYSIELFRRGCHSLFFPGGTRSRSGKVEKRLKKGLMGTGLSAWQENLAAGAERPEVFVVPCTLSTHLVLEAGTLVADALAREGRSRYIIVDDEFSRPREVANFFRRVLNLDESVHLTFSRPLDLLGNPLDEAGRSLDPAGRPVDRRAYVLGEDGRPVADAQRDRLYVQRLGERVVEAFHRDNVALSTHVACAAAWRAWTRRHPGRDVWRLVRLEAEQRVLPEADLLREVAALVEELRALASAGRIRLSLPPGAVGVLEDALPRLGAFHERPVLQRKADGIHVDPELTWYYRNRLVGYGLDLGAS